MIDFEFFGFQTDLIIKKNSLGYYIEGDFDYEIESLNHDEMRTGKVRMDLYGHRAISFELDDEFNYEELQDEVVETIQESDTSDYALTTIKEIEKINETNAPIISEGIYKTRLHGQEKYICTFRFKDNPRVFSAIIYQKKIEQIIAGRTNPLEIDFFVTDIIDADRILHYFLYQSKERIRMMF